MAPQKNATKISIYQYKEEAKESRRGEKAKEERSHQMKIPCVKQSKTSELSRCKSKTGCNENRQI